MIPKTKGNHNHMGLTKQPVKAAAKVNLLILALSLFFLFACSNDNSRVPSESSNLEGFTFFNLGSESLLSDQIRDNLENHLGSEAIARRATLDLSIHSPDFLNQYFPHLEALNTKLNWPPRERVEHNITKLMYRYASKNELPFKYVELFFSNYSGKPLFFRIFASSKGDSTIEALKGKYGTPKEILWSENNFKTLFWQKQKDVLTASLIKNRYDQSEYLFCIFYVKNLEELVEKEKIEQKAKEEKIEDAGRSVF
jgi:hypothetical protein